MQFIEKCVKGKRGRVGLVHARMKQKDRTATIEAFTDVMAENGERKREENYQILVGTTRLIGAGLQLTRANHVVLMEPDFEFFRELQGYARVHRIGQKSIESYSYRLIDAGSAIEQTILKRQRERNEFTGRLVGGEADLEREKKIEAGLVPLREPKENLDESVSPKIFSPGPGPSSGRFTDRALSPTLDDSTIGLEDETSEPKAGRRGR
jgi:superfamily II DNA/RNA helicase